MRILLIGSRPCRDETGLPTLTIWTPTINGAEKLRRVLPSLRKVADQLVVGVDDASCDSSEDVAREFADLVLPISHEHYTGMNGDPNHITSIEVAMPHFSGDWIFRVDHDETLGPTLENRSRIDSLLDDRHTTHYWIPRRWVIPPGDRFVSSHPWHVDYQMRLYRNLPSIVDHTKHVHGHSRVLGQGVFLNHDWLLHWDLVWHSRAAREAKERYCASISEYTGADYYFYEGQEHDTLPLEYVPPSPPLPAPLEELRSPLGCSVFLLECPGVMKKGQYYTAIIGIENRSTREWYPASVGHYEGNVHISYHWYRQIDHSSEVYQWDGPRADLPMRLLPGRSLSTCLRVEAPSVPGNYRLQPDLVEEGVAWASSSMTLPAWSVMVI